MTRPLEDQILRWTARLDNAIGVAMGRRETPVPKGPLREFALALRELRIDAPGTPTYRQLAQKANYSPSVLSRAAAGHTLPTLEVTLAFVAACRGDVEEWRRRWNKLHAELQRAHPDLITAADEPRLIAEESGEAAADNQPRRLVGRWPIIAGATAVIALAVIIAVASPWSSEAERPPTPPPTATPSPTSAYAPVYLDRRLPLPNYNFYFDLRTGVVAEGDGPWSMSTNSGGDGRGAFEIPDDTDIYVSTGPSLTPDRCAAQASPASRYGVRFRQVPPGTFFCLRSRKTGDVAVIKVVDTDDGNYAAKIAVDLYQHRR
ncbi:helix-turn-helix transcriptional regulator [Nonomuraea sp. NPDC001636]|uniref:helix-turn-helix domain-containing protein n=1 Tax=Nonomuraea sp. NPDC001636 TaxID=3154391 RepID=UPI00332384D9